jgi:uncharacterized membrane protein YoaK (UPF0700 family)
MDGSGGSNGVTLRRLIADPAHGAARADARAHALVTAAIAGPHLDTAAPDSTAALLALAMGAQNAAVRQLRVFDLTTTVLTMTLTGIAADFRQRDRFAIVRRVLAVGAVLAGATAGSILALQVSDVAALALAAALLAVVVAYAMAASRAPRRGGRASTR